MCYMHCIQQNIGEGNFAVHTQSLIGRENFHRIVDRLANNVHNTAYDT